MKKIATSLLACACGLAVTAQTYELVTLDGTTNESGAYGVNSSGRVCGYKVVGGIPRPFLWSPNKSWLQLPQPSGIASTPGIAYAIDDFQDVAGTYGTFTNLPYRISSGTAAVWNLDNSGSNYITININVAANVGSGQSMNARDVNDNDDVVGSVSGSPNDYGYAYNVLNQTWYIADINPGYDTMLHSINAYGDTAGETTDSYSSGTPYPIYIKKESDGTHTVYSGANIGGGIYLPSGGFKVNANDQVVGIANNQGFYWEPLTGRNVLLGGGTACYCISDNGIIVGSTNGHACMWTTNRDGSFSMTDLNRLTGNTNVVLETAFGVNTNDQIVGQALVLATSVRSAFLLTPSKGVQAALTKITNGLSLSWMAAANHDYAIHTSVDLKTWTPLPDIYWANDTNAWVTVIPNQRKMFFEVFDLTP